MCAGMYWRYVNVEILMTAKKIVNSFSPLPACISAHVVLSVHALVARAREKSLVCACHWYGTREEDGSQHRMSHWCMALKKKKPLYVYSLDVNERKKEKYNRRNKNE